jgi:hypothetical protein
VRAARSISFLGSPHRRLSLRDVEGATVHVYPMPFGREAPRKPPLPNDLTYETPWVPRIQASTLKLIW